MGKLMTVEDVAEFLGFSEWTIRKYLRERKIEGVRLGGEWRVEESEVLEFLNKLKRRD